MQTKIFETLQELRNYARQKNIKAGFFFHEEDSYLMRFANSAISLNTNEHLIRLFIEVFKGRQKADYEMITNFDQLDAMKQGIDLAAEMAEHAQPLNYDPTLPELTETCVDQKAYDKELATMSSQDRLASINDAVKGLETDDLKLSGIFSSGATIFAASNTLSDHVLFYAMSDAQITTVLAHEKLKWEVIAEQSAQNRNELNPQQIHQELSFLLKHYQNDVPEQLPLGHYDVVLGPAATAELVSFLNWVGFSGTVMKRGYSFLKEEDEGRKIFSEKFNLTDDPSHLATYPQGKDFSGIQRSAFPLIQNGVFQKFTWDQDGADEFGQTPTGHSVMHNSLVLQGGNHAASSIADLLAMPRERDILYIPFLHYMNVVNYSKGIVTGSSRFGALLLQKDGGVKIPYNVRLTQSYQNLFGENLDWLSQETVAYNTSSSYGLRNPTAVIVPKLIKISQLEISHSNSSY